MDGFINLNKDRGPSSHNAVAAMRRLFHVKAGHCGTLDPQADGVLPICLGSATKLADYVTGGSKRYRAGIIFGIETDSYDAAGSILFEKDASMVTRDHIQSLLPRFCGEIMQAPPAVSALKQGGVPMYKRMRRGEQVELIPRPVHIFELQLLEFRQGNKAYAEIEIACGKGTYIRSLAHDLGELTGTGAHVCSLQRIKVGDFWLKDAYTVEQITQMAEKGDMSFLLPMQFPLSNMPKYVVSEKQINTIAHGNPLIVTDTVSPFEVGRVEDAAGRMLGLAGLSVNEDGSGILQMTKVFIPAPPVGPNGFTGVAIGNFDGVHLGHKALLANLAEQKKQYGGKTAVITFTPHPLSVICSKTPRLLNTAEQKKKLICDIYGVDALIELPFDRKLMNTSPEDFFDTVISAKLNAQRVTVGYNFTFAAAGQGTAATLRKLGVEKGVEVSVVNEVICEYGAISSSYIRRKIAEGDLIAANQMLGYWYTISGSVIKGNQIGRTIGFPTANILPEANLVMLPMGVYAARIEHRGNVYDGVANFGFKPTIGGENKPLLEANIFNVDAVLYGENISVSLGLFIRPERRYSGIDKLKEQIAQDSLVAKKFLSQLPADCHLPKPIL